MSANKGTKKADSLLLRVMREIHKTAETPEKGYRSTDQWAAHWGLGRSRARQYIFKAIELGLMEQKTFRIAFREDAKPYPLVHYREVKGRQRRT